MAVHIIFRCVHAPSVLLLLVLFGGCGESPSVPPVKNVPAHSTYRDSLIENVPHIRQKPDFCGEACAAMYLNFLGEEVDQDYVFDAAGVDPSVGRGLIARELNDALLQIGFATGTVWTPVSSKRQIHKLLASMLQDLSKGIPSIVCMNTTDDEHNTEHFRLILGYDRLADEIIYHEPAMENGAYQRMALETFVNRWPLKSESGPDTVVRMRLNVEALSYGRISTTPTAADYVQHVMGQQHRIPEDFVVMVEPPFVVIGNGSPEQVAVHAGRTVRWSVELLKRDFFNIDPSHILDVWVFEDEASYMAYAKSIFGDTPDTPYGYYSSADEALVMNIGLGGGTLVHEIVHPFIETNFPDCPAWFNEGLGSLYEWPQDLDGHIMGVVNWRLNGLQDAIENGSLGSFERLMNLSREQFYSDRTGSNYAQSRYLLQYLQYRRKLVPYYHEFVKNIDLDPSGMTTLKSILNIRHMSQFEREWRNWVTTLEQGTVPLE